MDNGYDKTIGRFRLRVESNDSGLNAQRVVLTNPVSCLTLTRMDAEELRDLHYITGRALASIELEKASG